MGAGYFTVFNNKLCCIKKKQLHCEFNGPYYTTRIFFCTIIIQKKTKTFHML